MKHFIINALALAATIFSASCNKEFNGNVQPLAASGEQQILFVVKNYSPSTKSVSAAADSTLSNVQIAVYNPDSLLVASGVTTSGTLTMSLPAGVAGYKVVALANSPLNIANITRFESVAGQTSTMNAACGLEMIDVLNHVTFNPAVPVDLTLKHMAAKVQLDCVRDSIPYDAGFSIQSIYLVNVNTVCKFDFSVPSPDYKQVAGYQALETSITPLTYDAVNVALTTGNAHTTPHYFYCYPNPVDGGKQTRLVVQAEFGGNTYYYPVNITPDDVPVANNLLYRINAINITGPGSTSPDVPVEKGNITFTLSVSSWGDGYSQQVTI